MKAWTFSTRIKQAVAITSLLLVILITFSHSFAGSDMTQTRLSPSLQQGGPQDPIPTVDFGSQVKSVVARLDFNGPDQVSLNTGKVAAGYPPTHLGDPPLLHIRLLDYQGQVLKEFNDWNPLLALEENGSTDSAITLPQATGRFVLPFFPTLKIMEIVDIPRQKTLASIDLGSAVLQPFCRQHPQDKDCAQVPPDPRITNGLQALYLFGRGAGTTINDVSGVGTPLNLTLADPATASWSSDGLTMSAPTQLASAGPATKVIDAISTTNELTFETWVTPAAVQQPLASVMALAGDQSHVDAFLAQDGTKGRYQAQLRTNTKALESTTVRTGTRVSTPALQHIVLTRDATGLTRVYVNGVLKGHITHKGTFAGWDTTYRLALGNTIAGDAPWLGAYHLAAIYNRALSPAEVHQNFQAGPAGSAGTPPNLGTQASYTFEEGSGTTVHDVSGVGTALDLQVANPTATRWVSGGLQVLSPTLITALDPATKISEAVRASNEVALEAWVVPSDLKREGVTRILTLSANPSHRNIALSQEREEGQKPYYRVRIRTTDTDDSGNNPPVFTPQGSLSGKLQHVVFTRDAEGETRIYVNGVERRHITTKGNLSTWDTTYRLALGDDFNGGPSWRGEYQFVGIYNRALSAAEVSQHFVSGPTSSAVSGGAQ